MEPLSGACSRLILLLFYLNFVFLKQPLADAEGAKRSGMIALLKSNGGQSYVSFMLLIYILPPVTVHYRLQVLECFVILTALFVSLSPPPPTSWF